MLNTSTRTAFNEEHSLFRDHLRRFLERHVTPNLERWEKQGMVDRAFWRACGETGLLCPGVPEQYGGLGLDFRYNAVFLEELFYLGSIPGPVVHSDVVTEYLLHYGSEDQKQFWFPRMIAGQVVTAIAMTEPDAGSDLQAIKTTAVRDGDIYVINGTKTYITNGQCADLVLVAVKTSREAGHRGMSLILVETSREGFARGRNLDKIGQKASDTTELFFNDVRVPIANLLGEEGKGFSYLMAQLPVERLGNAIIAQAAAQRAFDEAVAFTKARKAFGKTVFDFQNTRFTLADLAAKLQVGWAHIDWAITRHINKELTATEASAAKLFHSELQFEVCDKALQLHGGAGYMNEYPIARFWRDARVQRIYSGTSEIMKEVIGRSI
ncbi:acyl-CoA dehydrogenase family protein [Burkholderia sp. Bp9142]|uniref:acyl-CoA dehydrogenase family protein n=1 Tax=Burkholderia sp. Bp9142 TaxID=2184573 RepID=UPI000F5AB802|nr:acyl-CoA dehydrogenase family protein [Burkholderia sp. Bp9142]RQR24599.1 acyl-CoA dehydrogenase [Burkholderia sp. Bp9142]